MFSEIIWISKLKEKIEVSMIEHIIYQKENQAQ